MWSDEENKKYEKEETFTVRSSGNDNQTKFWLNMS